MERALPVGFPNTSVIMRMNDTPKRTSKVRRHIIKLVVLIGGRKDERWKAWMIRMMDLTMSGKDGRSKFIYKVER